jgi:hypothetical protein
VTKETARSETLAVLPLERVTPEELEAFGVTDEDARDTSEWLRLRMGTILGADGRGGTGTFIELPDGRAALLTARHVVVRCILTGEMTAARLTELGARSVEPLAIRIDCRKDAAFLVFNADELPGEVVPFKEWSQPAPELVAGIPAIVSGVVGEWKQPDLATRTIPATKWLRFWTGVTDPRDHQGYIVCDVDEANPELPKSFRGMSGGPCISTNRRLLGVNMGEIRRKAGAAQGEFFVTPLSDLGNLFNPYAPPADAPSDYMHQQGRLAFTAVSRNDKRVKVPAVVSVEYLWSRSEPDGPHGRVGRIIAARFGEANGGGRYVINTESVFHWYDGDTDEDRLRALYDELAFFLQDTGFEMAVETPHP